MEDIIENLKNWSVGISQPPLRLELWISGKCNLRCKFCGTWKHNQQDTLSLNDYIKIIKDAARLGVKECYISGGGEPFINKDVTLKIMSEIKKREMKGYVITNGTLLNEEDEEFIIKIKWDMISFSLEACTPTIHNFLTGKKGVFNIVIKNIQYLSQLKKETNSLKPEIFINTVITNKNYREVCRMIKRGWKLNVNNISFQSLMNSTNFCKNLRLNQKDLKILRNMAKKAELLSKELGIGSNINNFMDPKYIEEANDVKKLFLESVKNEKGFLSIPCFDPWWHIMITHDGKVGPCANWATKIQENILSSSLEKIWFGENFNSFRERIKSKNLRGCRCCIPYVFDTNRLRFKLKEKINNSI